MDGRTAVLVDAENVRRSRWPNLSASELVERAREWARANDKRLVVVFDGPPYEDAADLVVGESSADEWLAAHASKYVPYWLVTSDRELRERAGGTADRIVGGGTFLEMIASTTRS